MTIKEISPFIFLLMTSCLQEENTLFSRIDAGKSNIHFTNEIIEFPEFNVFNYEYLYNGGGVAVGDLNNDGLADIVFSGNMVTSQIYLNKGDLKFENITEKSGFNSNKGWKTGVSLIDINGDGYLDIYLCHSGLITEYRCNELFINNGDETFTERAAEFGLDDCGTSTHAAFLDFDLDGDPDVFVLNHALKTPSAKILMNDDELRNSYDSLAADRLYENRGGLFVEVSREKGILGNKIGFGLGLVITDINNDGYPDIYVGNDYFEKDYLYINHHGKYFKDQLASYFNHSSRFSMGADIGDINNDGLTDLVSLDMRSEDNFRLKTLNKETSPKVFKELLSKGYHHQYVRNMLQLNNGTGKLFSEIGQLAGIESTDWSWAPLLADFNNDGLNDLFVTNGYLRELTNGDFIMYELDSVLKHYKKLGVKEDMTRITGLMRSEPISNYIFQNMGNLQFERKIDEWGINYPSFSNGAAYSDLDNDGDLDLITNNINEKAFIFENRSEKLDSANYLKIRLIGSDGNTYGIGSKIWLYIEDDVQYKEVFSSRGFQSSVDPVQHFGLGANNSVDSLVVLWPDSTLSYYQNVQSNQLLKVAQKDGTKSFTGKKSEEPETLLKYDSTGIIEFRHMENEFSDFDNFYLRYFKLSTLGPKPAIGDFDNDGLEDFFIPGASGFPSKLFRQKKDHSFEEWQHFGPEKEYEDVTGQFIDADGDGWLDLYVVTGGSEFSSDDSRLEDRFYRNDGSGRMVLQAGKMPGHKNVGSSIVSSDFNNDGIPDLFVGSRLKPGKYPENPIHKVLIGNGTGSFEDQTANYLNDIDLGMITDVESADLNNDGFYDLVAVGEWMPVTVLENNAGSSFEDKTNLYNLGRTDGWWHSLTLDDTDEDGDIDLICGNIGSNFQFNPSDNEPLKIWVVDIDENGMIDPIITERKDGKDIPIHYRDELILHIPPLHKIFRRYETYARADIEDLIGKKVSQTKTFQANTFYSTIFVNDNLQFQPVTLPPEAQFSMINASVVLDVNEDGFKDILAAGNFYGLHPTFGRMDAGSGVVLLGNGKNEFKPMRSNESGFYAPWNVRSMNFIQLGLEKKIIIAVNNGNIESFSLKHKKLIATGQD